MIEYSTFSSYIFYFKYNWMKNLKSFSTNYRKDVNSPGESFVWMLRYWLKLNCVYLYVSSMFLPLDHDHRSRVLGLKERGHNERNKFSAMGVHNCKKTNDQQYFTGPLKALGLVAEFLCLSNCSHFWKIWTKQINIQIAS